MSENVDGELLALVARSDVRQTVLDALRDGEGTPQDVTERVDVSRQQVSRALGDLREAGAVELLVPEETAMGRVHGLTDDGRAALKRVEAR